MNKTKKLAFIMAALFTMHLSFSAVYSMQTEEEQVIPMLRSLNNASKDHITNMQNRIACGFLSRFYEILNNLTRCIISERKQPQTEISTLFNLLNGKIKSRSWSKQVKCITNLQDVCIGWMKNKNHCIEQKINGSLRSRLIKMNMLCKLLAITTMNKDLSEEHLNTIAITFLNTCCSINPRSKCLH